MPHNLNNSSILFLCPGTKLQVGDRSLEFVSWFAHSLSEEHCLSSQPTLQIQVLVLEFIALEKKFTSIDWSVLWHRNTICGFFGRVAFPITPFQNAVQHFQRFRLLSQARGGKWKQGIVQYVCSQNNYPEKTLTLIQIMSEARKCNLCSLGGRKKWKYLQESSPCP